MHRGFHRRAQAFDVQPHAMSGGQLLLGRSEDLGFLGRSRWRRRSDAAEFANDVRAVRVERRELQAELAALFGFCAPGHPAFDQDLLSFVLETAHEFLTELRQVTGAQGHAPPAQVAAFPLERSGLALGGADIDQLGQWDAGNVRMATVESGGHGDRVPAHPVPVAGGYARYRVGQRPEIGQEITDWCREAGIVKVLVLSAPVDPPLYVEREGRLVTLGRDAQADVRLPDPTVSFRHASLKKRGEQYLLTDEGSTNGTALCGPGGPPVWLSAGSPRLVKDGDRLLLGAVQLELRLESSADGRPSDDLARDLVTASLAALRLPIETEHVDAALEELSTLDDESMTPVETPTPEPAADRAGIVSGGKTRLATDLMVGGIALLVLVVSGLGLHFWVLER
jgi:pSer/pThr/pTyr-binding forkhead associated (FHA) protein